MLQSRCLAACPRALAHAIRIRVDDHLLGSLDDHLDFGVGFGQGPKFRMPVQPSGASRLVGLEELTDGGSGGVCAKTLRTASDGVCAMIIANDDGMDQTSFGTRRLVHGDALSGVLPTTGSFGVTSTGQRCPTGPKYNRVLFSLYGGEGLWRKLYPTLGYSK